MAYGQLDITQIRDAGGFVALRHCCHLGRMVAVTCPSGRELGPLLVVDCASCTDGEWLDSIQFAADLFGRELWEKCALPGVTAWVEVTRWE